MKIFACFFNFLMVETNVSLKLKEYNPMTDVHELPTLYVTHLGFNLASPPTWSEVWNNILRDKKSQVSFSFNIQHSFQARLSCKRKIVWLQIVSSISSRDNLSNFNCVYNHCSRLYQDRERKQKHPDNSPFSNPPNSAPWGERWSLNKLMFW